MSDAPSPAAEPPFDVDAFLAHPLTARLATRGPTVRPVWYLWEDGAFWTITGPRARMPGLLRKDLAVALVVDSCDLRTGEVLQVTARGRAELLPFDAGRGARRLARCLGPDTERWDARFRDHLHGDPDELGTLWARIRPDRSAAKDLGFEAGGAAPSRKAMISPIPGEVPPKRHPPELASPHEREQESLHQPARRRPRPGQDLLHRPRLLDQPAVQR
ncbi:pyridoxamine 5'-phosphate oxidase family protein [Nocardiopsis suaedae]|uniref:Pyridoxamine 5'-phosphate oxidase family protein n=1 Tax=Nocardiopsis suaedae TaxID=3018444 RepID=A0ABT4THJ2_9ACTN|nr:pyridoxamine 5'-phosphate oxidase family protein [Nocardiopsis suaedae]MDA2803734.1 pyridoxamine 5'-phosphate oxidase family protein [Nocardiopsis suaedae]